MGCRDISVGVGSHCKQEYRAYLITMPAPEKLEGRDVQSSMSKGWLPAGDHTSLITLANCQLASRCFVSRLFQASKQGYWKVVWVLLLLWFYPAIGTDTVCSKSKGKEHSAGHIIQNPNPLSALAGLPNLTKIARVKRHSVLPKPYFRQSRYLRHAMWRWGEMEEHLKADHAGCWVGQKPPFVLLAFSGWKLYHWQLPWNLDPGELNQQASSLSLPGKLMESDETTLDCTHSLNSVSMYTHIWSTKPLLAIFAWKLLLLSHDTVQYRNGARAWRILKTSLYPWICLTKVLVGGFTPLAPQARRGNWKRAK